MPRGGARKGAGRKEDLLKKKRYGTRLRPDQIEWLREPGRNAAKEIETSLDKHIECCGFFKSLGSAIQGKKVDNKFMKANLHTEI